MATARTVTQVIQGALRVLGVLAAGETVDSNDTATGIIAFQDLISEWGSEGITVPSITTGSITLVAAQASYTVGEDGTPDLDTPRFESVLGAYIRDANSYDYPVTVRFGEQYLDIGNKATPGRPKLLWYNPTAPNGTVYVYPTPATAETLVIYGYKPMTDPAQLTDDMLNDTGIPRGYHNALKWNLAIEMAPEYGIEPSIHMHRRAETGKDKIISANVLNRVKAIDLVLPYTGNLTLDNIVVSGFDGVTWQGGGVTW